MPLVTFNTVLDACARVGRMEHAAKIMEDMKIHQVEANIVTYSTMLKGHCQNGNIKAAYAALEQAKKHAQLKARDVEMIGMLHVNDIRDLLHQAMLGLSRMQIYTVISEAEIAGENKIAYASFIPRAVGLIRSMLSFEKSIVKSKRRSPTKCQNGMVPVKKSEHKFGELNNLK